MKAQENISPERWAVAAIIVMLSAPIAAVAGAAFGIPFRVGMLVALVLGLTSCFWIARRLPREWDGLRRVHRGWLVFLLVLGLGAVARTTGVAWYMADSTHTQGAVYWFDWFYTDHSCYSGYWRAAEVARAGVENLYDTKHYTGSVGRFEFDEFLYVPQFLILPRIGLALGGDFYKIRAAWFAFEASLLAAATLALCSWLGGATGRRAALLLPALWISTPILATLQIGNFQLAAIALSMLAMVAFERDRHGTGGALLAVAGFKLFPGLLCVYLVAAKRWRPLVWTIGFSLLYCLVTYVWMGIRPFEAFLHYDWPRLVSGEAWAFVENPKVSAINDSVSGLVLKLKILGAGGMSHSLEDAVGWVWSILVVILAVLAGRRSPQLSRLQRACCWIALLTLAAFRARFMPDVYGLIGPLLLWFFIAASAPLTRRNVGWLAGAWLALDAVLPFHGVPLVGNYRLMVSTASQLIAIGLCFAVLFSSLRRSPRTEESVAVMAAHPPYEYDEK